MCMLCVEWEKQRITSKEAFKAIGEMITPTTKEHLQELAERIIQKEVPETQTNKDAEEAFWNATHPED